MRTIQTRFAIPTRLKISIVLWVAILLLVTVPTSHAADPSPAGERERIAKSIAKHIDEEKYADLPDLFQQKAMIESKMFGPKSDELLATHDEFSRVLETLGDFGTAVVFRRKILEIRTEVCKDPDDWRIITARLDLEDARARAKLFRKQRAQLVMALLDGHRANDLRVNGKKTEALKLERERLLVIENLVGINTQDYIIGLVNLADYLGEAGDHLEAAIHADRAAKLAKSLVGEKHPLFATVLNAQAVTAINSGECELAIKQLRLVKQVRAAALSEAHVDYANAAINLGMAYRDSGDIKAAEKESRIAVAILSKAGDDNRSNYATALSNHAGTLAQLGDYSGAMQAYKNALAEERRCVPAIPSRIARTLSNFASLYVDLNDFDTAFAHYREAEMLLAVNNPLSLADVLNNLGILHSKRARSFDSKEDYTTAIDSHRRALKIRTSELMRSGKRGDHPLIGRSHFNLGDAYAVAGRLEDAASEYAQALKIFELSLGQNHLYLIELSGSLGKLHLRRGRAKEALNAFKESERLSLSVFTDKHPSYLVARSNVAVALVELGRREEAISLLQKVVVQWGAIRDNAFETLSKRQRLQYLMNKQSSLDLYLSLALEEKNTGAVLCSLALSCKGQFTAREAAERLVRDYPAAKPLADRYLELCTSIKVLTEKVGAGGRTDQTKLLREKENEKEEIEVKLSGFGRHFRQVDDDLQKAVDERLPLSVGLVEYLTYSHLTGGFTPGGHAKYETRMLAVVLRRGRPPAIVPLGARAPIATAAAQWRESVSRGITPQSGGALSDLIWEPIRGHLDKVKTVVVSPDGPICSIPLAALPIPGSSNDAVLLDEYAFGYVTSIRQWIDRETRPVTSPSAGALVVAHLNYGAGAPDHKSPTFSEIPHDEVGLNSLLKGLRGDLPNGEVKLMSGAAEATTANFCREFAPSQGTRRYKYVHLETHGFSKLLKDTAWPKASDRESLTSFLDPNTLLRSSGFRTGVAFNGANNSSAGVLTGEEIAVLDLKGVDLIVLSVCESGIGDTVPNEGSFALGRSFQTAGASTTVSSLWSVPITETRTLMADFYRNLWALGGTRKLESLRNAQLAARRGRGSEPLPPLYWAGWAMSGDPGDISDLKDPETSTVILDPAQEDVPEQNGDVWRMAIWMSCGLVGIASVMGVHRIYRYRRSTMAKAGTARLQ